MLPRKYVGGFLWRFILVYGLLIVPWPGFNEAYGRYFRALGQMVFPQERGARFVRFEAVPAELRRGLDTRIALANPAQLDGQGSGPVRYLELDTRGIGWVPTALLLALVLATPVPWRRRVWAFFFGVIAIHGFILFSVAVYLWNNSTDLGLLTLTPFWKQTTDGLEETLITQMGAGFVVPVLLWIVVTLRRQDGVRWQRG